MAGQVMERREPRALALVPTPVLAMLCSNAPCVGVLTESTAVVGSVTRDDVAACVVKALFSKKSDNKVSYLLYPLSGGLSVTTCHPVRRHCG
jgi:hypothetical protein